MKKIFVFLFLFTLIFSTIGCKKKDDLTEISQGLNQYNISLEVDVENKSVFAKQNLKYINKTSSVLKTIKFHLYPQFFEEGATDYIVPSTKMNLAFPNGISYASFNVDRVQVENAEQPVKYSGEFDSILVVELNSSLMPNETTDLYFEYSFTLPNSHHRFGYGDNTINLANFYPIACVFEDGEFVTNPYNSNGDPFYSDVANYSVDIKVDNQYIVAGTGVKTEKRTDEKTKNVTFKSQVVRDFACVLSNKFKLISNKANETLVEYFYFDDPNPNKSLQTGIDAITTFSNMFGDYPYKTFSIVETDFVYGGMEYPTLIMISSQIENSDDYSNVIIHETAHQWWYGIVGNNEFKYPWLDEALTEYSTILFYDNCSGYNFTHSEMVDISKENYSLFVSVYEDVLGKIDTSMRAVNEYSTEPEYTYCTYIKGVLMFDSLYQLIGKKDFNQALKTYYNNNKFSNAAPNDLIQAFNETSKQNLENFFSSWIDGKVVIK